MNKQNAQNTKAKHKELSTRTIGALIVSLVIISIFPIFVTIAPQQWPPQSSVIILDLFYLLILAGYLAVLAGWNRSKWLIITMVIVSILGVTAMGWLILMLGSFKMNF